MAAIEDIGKNEYYLKIKSESQSPDYYSDIASSLRNYFADDRIIYIDMADIRTLPEELFNLFHSLVPEALKKNSQLIFINSPESSDERMRLLSSHAE